MKYNLQDPDEKRKAFAYLTQLCGRKGTVDIKKISERRSLSQNAYLHLLIGLFGDHFGYFPEEAKQIYKELNSDIFKYSREVNGVTRAFWRSSADITKEEMALSIDRLKIASASHGFELPDSADQGWVRYAQNQLERVSVG